jgi:hypothetical protein
MWQKAGDMTKEQKMLNRLATLQGKLRRLQGDRQKAISSVLSGRAKAAYERITKEFATLESSVAIEAAELEAQIKDHVTQSGATISGKSLMAVYVSGKTSWNTDKLDGLALKLPEINECKTVGKPFVNIRPVMAAKK